MLDTALALQALHAANYPDLSVSNTALAYLTNNQNPDGGWGSFSGDASSVYMTAVISATLQKFPQTTTIANALTKATANLSMLQNADGGFGDPSSTIYETALAYSALVAVSTDAVILGKAVNYLTTAQLADGSWNDDPYSTALALKALYLSGNKPSPPPPASTTGSVMATIVDATTNAPIPGVSAVLVNDSSFSATTDANGMFALSGIPTGAQQIALSHAGYATLTITASISAGTFINVGKVAMSVNPTTGTVEGIVWNADKNAPFGGVTVQVTGTFYQAISAADGSYKITDVTPGTITVGTPSGPGGAVYWNVPVTGTLAPGGIFIYNPMMSTTPPPFMNLYAQTDKALYKKGDTVGLSFTLQNNRSIAYSATLNVRVTDPSGAGVYSTSVAENLVAKGTTTQDISFALPTTGTGGFYSVSADAYDTSGTKLASATTTFGVFSSQIAVTPVLPAVFSGGTNTVSFNLTNTGTYAVSSGSLGVTLTDPDGQVISSTSQPFTLGLNEAKSLTYALPVPPVKFGTYTLSYIQSDETITGQTTTLPISNTVAISPLLFDRSSYKVRDKANLMVSINNTGKFTLDPATGSGLTVNLAAPDAGYTDSKIISLGTGTSAATFNYSIALPSGLATGQHTATVTITLPSGSTTVQTSQFSVPASSLSVILNQASVTAGGTVSPVISNTGGVDTGIQYTLSLFDSKAALISQQATSQPIQAGSSITAPLSILSGAADGNYSLIANYKDMSTGENDIVTLPLTIAGVKAGLSAQTDKQTYLTTENITSLSTITNTGTILQNGNLHLQVVTAGGNQQQKTWSSQYDFQQGVRNGVDTYGVNDWFVLSDDFNGNAIANDKWLQDNYGVYSQVEGAGYLKQTAGPGAGYASLFGKAYPLLQGDLDVQVDFNLMNFPSFGVSWAIFRIEALNQEFRVARLRSQSLNVYWSQYWNGSSWTEGPQFSTTDTSGKLRITKSGTTVNSYYWQNGAWVQIWSTTIWNGPSNVRFWTTNDYNSNSVEVHWSNFKLNAGQIVTKNETVDSVRLLPLNDNFDDGLINLDRWTLYHTANASVSEQNGKLIVESALAGTQISAGVNHKMQVTGDVVAQVDYGLIGWQSQNMEKLGLFLMPDAIRFYGIERIYDSHWYGNSYVSDFNSSSFSGVSTSDMQGSLRIGRTNGAIVSSYLTQNGWTAQNQAQIGSNTGSYTISLWNDPGYTNPITKISFDNFQISGAGKYAPQGTLTENFDAGSSTKWFSLTWSSTQPLGTSIKFRTRTAQTETDLAAATWSDYITASGSVIPSSQGRWIEVEATLATTDTSTTPLLHDMTVTYGTNPGDVLWQTDVPVNLATSAVSNLSNVIGTLNAPGKLYLQGTLTSSTGQTIATSEYPFYIIRGNTALLFNTDKRIYKPGETVTITGQVTNSASVAASGLNIQLMSGSQILFNTTADVPANGSYPFTVTTPAGAAGVYPLTGIVTQNGSTLAQIADQYQVSSPAVTATQSAPDAAGNDPFVVTLTFNNTGKVDAGIGYTLADSHGNTIDSQNSTIPAGQSKILQYNQQISADTTYSFTITGDLIQTLTKTVTYSGTIPDTSVSTKIVTDKMSYNANEQVAINSTVTGQSANTVTENLSPWISVQDSQGRVLYADTAVLPQLNQGQMATINNYWNTANYPAGTYTVKLIIANGSTILSTSQATFQILDSSQSGTGLSAGVKGTVSVDKTRLLAGEPVALSFTVTNTGNTDLQNVAVSVQILDTLNATVYAAFGYQTTLPLKGTYSNIGQLDTTIYTAKDYLVILQATTVGITETIGSAYFRIEGAPSAPSLVGPENGSDVLTFTPLLSVNNASDPNDDKLTYEFEVYGDTGLTNLVISSGTITAGTGMTSWTVPVTLTENQTYTWRSRAYDGWLYGPWMAPATFRVNTVNDPPTAPTIASPVDGTSVATFTPTLTINNATDPDSPSLTYNFIVALDPALTQITATTTGVTSGQGSTPAFAGAGSTSWQLPVTLAENTWYYWRAQADDWFTTGPWSATSSFFVNTVNNPPTMPVIINPANNSTIAALVTDVTASNSTDPDSPVITYFFELDTVTTFDSPNIIRSGGIAQGQGMTTWHVTGLQEDTQYYVRSKASDGQADSPWSSTVGFFANAVNEPPTTPTLANPSSGSGVTVFTPTLSIHNATDPDREVLTYDFEVYSDSGLTTLVTSSIGIAETSQITSWTMPMALTENHTYYWRARAYDGQLYSAWMTASSFMVNTVNDAPSAPTLSSPADGSSVATLLPTLAIVNATDPDSPQLTYNFEIYSGGTLAAQVPGVPEGGSGITSVTLGTPLTDNTAYQWRAQAFDGNLYGPWTAMANFMVHIAQIGITATIDFDPDTLNKSSDGTWVVVFIELPAGYNVKDIDVSSIRLEGTIPAEPWPYAIGDHDKDGIPDLMVKFNRSDVVNLLPNGDQVTVHVTGKVGATSFDGVDIIRVMK